MTGTTGAIRFDPHVHTEASHDALGSISEVLAAAGDSHLHAVAITDHDTVTAAQRALSLQDEYDVVVVPGVEISTADGHLLALGVGEQPPVGVSIGETVEWVQSEGGVTVVPHPFQRSRHGVRKRDVPDVDAVETFNAWSMTGIQNRRARRFASREGYAPVGASDAHEPGMVGYGYTELSIRLDGDRPTAADVLGALADGEPTARGRTASAVEYLGKYTRSVGAKTRSTVEQTVFGVD